MGWRRLNRREHAERHDQLDAAMALLRHLIDNLDAETGGLDARLEGAVADINALRAEVKAAKTTRAKTAATEKDGTP